MQTPVAVVANCCRRPAGLPVQVLVRVRLAKHSARAHLPPQVVLFHADCIGNKKRKVFSSFLGSSLFSVVVFFLRCFLHGFPISRPMYTISNWLDFLQGGQLGSTYYLSSISYWDTHSDILISKHCKETMKFLLWPRHKYLWPRRSQRPFNVVCIVVMPL